MRTREQPPTWLRYKALQEPKVLPIVEKATDESVERFDTRFLSWLIVHAILWTLLLGYYFNYYASFGASLCGVMFFAAYKNFKNVSSWLWNGIIFGQVVGITLICYSCGGIHCSGLIIFCGVPLWTFPMKHARFWSFIWFAVNAVVLVGFAVAHEVGFEPESTTSLTAFSTPLLHALVQFSAILYMLAMPLGGSRIIVAVTQFAKVAREHAEDGSRVKSKFVSNLSQRMRTPLARISDTIDVLFAKTPFSASSRTRIVMIKRSTDRLCRIVEDVLDFAEADAGAFPVSHVSFSLDQIVRRACFPFERKCLLNGISFGIDIQFHSSLCVKGDPTRLIQCLTQLLDNSFKFCSNRPILVQAQISSPKKANEGLVDDKNAVLMPPPSPRRRRPSTASSSLKTTTPMTTTMRRFPAGGAIDSDDYYDSDFDSEDDGEAEAENIIVATISVIDNGVGMSLQAMNGLFQAFRTGDQSLTRKYDGTGLGLLMTRLIVHRLGGTIEIRSALNKGTVATLRVPFRMGTTSASLREYNTSSRGGRRRKFLRRKRSFSEPEIKPVKSMFEIEVRK